MLWSRIDDDISAVAGDVNRLSVRSGGGIEDFILIFIRVVVRNPFAVQEDGAVLRLQLAAVSGDLFGKPDADGPVFIFYIQVMKVQPVGQKGAGA